MRRNIGLADEHDDIMYVGITIITLIRAALDRASAGGKSM